MTLACITKPIYGYFAAKAFFESSGAKSSLRKGVRHL